MSEVYVASDHHFGQKTVLKWRDEFKTVEDMDETLIALHNSVVTKRDLVLFLGDLGHGRHALEMIKRMNGKKRLILGNHDTMNVMEYLKKGLFLSVHGSLRKKEFLFTHYPIIPDAIRRYQYTVHGHVHCERQDRQMIDRMDYFNANIDVMGYVPISLDGIRNLMKRRYMAEEFGDGWRTA